MSRISEAVLSDGRTIKYVETDDPPSGAMKHTFFTPDGSKVVQFFNDPEAARKDQNIMSRLEAITGRYNPTRPEHDGGAKGVTEQSAEYFAKCFCWPEAVVTSPQLGIVCPAYPERFIFGEEASPKLPLKGRDKKSNWFTSKNRKHLAAQELGDFRFMLGAGIMLARSVRRMHQAGLSHSDLSCNNVLIDPKTGTCIVIDIDSLVVPGLYPPEVAGTPKYIAPEVLETIELDFKDPNRKLPSMYTDLHALAVLLYEYLFLRHPLTGPKCFDKNDPANDDFLSFGSKALFIENPKDKSNRPNDLRFKLRDVGPMLEKLFLQAFVDGLHEPGARPSAAEWERALTKTWDLLHPCSNPKCPSKWFVLHDTVNAVCPFCGTPVDKSDIVRLHLKSLSRGNSAQWLNAGEINAYDGMPLCEWHVYPDRHPDERADREMLAYICKDGNGNWLLVNQKVKGMKSPSGNPVEADGHHVVILNDGVAFMMSENGGYKVEVTRGR